MGEGGECEVGFMRGSLLWHSRMAAEVVLGIIFAVAFGAQQ